MATALFDSPLGPLGLAASARGLVEVSLHGRVAPHGPEDDPAARAILDEACRQLREYFAGDRRVFDVPFDVDLGDGFRGRALTALGDVPFGHTITYGGLAEAAGFPKAARAAGTACSTNPLAVFIPCHRVVPASGGIGKYGGGESMKRALLELEGLHT
ncbi:MULTISPECIES: methylated-DNA--[protein]-cysteine S-methyltransferase [Corynebacterium]|uniref:methylated-DNA--[protein]-cysteine S-methyltransferase n=1 Tax=Corynebacterium TaxID=1716 RepID=UPI0008A18CC6|nr:MULTISPECIES: methylated-DNA--[protein]-cysteine S-methyltransferase [Corynebacterium]MCG7438542.1 methylated-DNA--[protein]-cysteine S-methyltransferase [Corynebacterium freneyi]OFU58027.1 cysteine methyltransferase [Corynebacterium sp. HMSC11E11]UBI02436.1 methylated-DNA--[protein]-cysteine S-methyltransferase [Corynebacterium freneyi]